MKNILQFINIDLNSEKHREEVIAFRRDSFIASFGDDSNFDKENYFRLLKEKIANYPDGLVLVKEDNKYIGQLELSIREYESKNIGYIHLYYQFKKSVARVKDTNYTNMQNSFLKTII